MDNMAKTQKNRHQTLIVGGILQPFMLMDDKMVDVLLLNQNETKRPRFELIRNLYPANLDFIGLCSK